MNSGLVGVALVLGFLLLVVLIVVFGIYQIAKKIINTFATRFSNTERISDDYNIGVVPVEGVIAYSSQKEYPFHRIMRNLELVMEDKPKALIVRINSPGGTVGASYELYAALKRISTKGVKVVGLMEDVAASGGFLVAMGCDHVIATPGVITGSIGVIMKTLEYGSVLDKYNLTMRVIKSGQFKDLGSPTKPMSDDERKILEELVVNAHLDFKRVVAKECEIEMSQVEKFADGRVFTGLQALELGLVDEVGSFHDAIISAMKLSGIEEGKAVVRELEPDQTLIEKIGIHKLRAKSLGDVASQHLSMISPEMCNRPLYLYE